MLTGRWDLTIDNGTETYPSWVEFLGAESRFVGRVGSARRVETVRMDGDGVYWCLPPQYESRKTPLEFAGRLEGDILVGTSQGDNGEHLTFRGTRAPDLLRTDAPRWGEAVELVGEDLSNWSMRSPEEPNNWQIVDGMLYNRAVGSDIVLTQPYMDFRLIAEYKYPAGSNSGIYLRGRYEFQIVDDFGHGPGVGTSGAIYGFITPERNAIKPADEWNTAEITLRGRHVTVILNGDTVVEDAEIPGITGGALDSREGEPGTMFLQGDHGPVVFRRLTIEQGL